MNFIPEERSSIINAVNNLPELYFIVDTKGIVQDCNATALRLLGRERNDIVNRQFAEVFDPSYLLKAEFEFNSCVDRSSLTSLQCRMRVDSEHYLDVVLTFSPFRSEYSGDEYVLCVARDVTLSKKKELDLLRFQFVAENTVNPLQITDLSGRMIYINKSFTRFSGYEPADLLGKNPSVLGSKKHSKKFWMNMWETISSGKPWDGEVENVTKDGSPLYTHLLISPIVNDVNAVIGYFGVHRDISEQRKLEKQLIHTQKMESIGTLAAGVAHEVGNPLASISALVQIIQRMTTDTFIIEKLELVKKQVTRISKIIRDLVDFSRPSNYEVRLTDINSVLSEAIEIISVGKKAKSVRFTQSLEEPLPELFLVSDQIQQVFVNILINAVDALVEKHEQMGEEFEPEIEVASFKTDSFVTVIFRDNGPGVPEHLTSKIFEPFFTTKKEGKGTGLGLWVSYGIVKSFQGDLKVNSKPGEWTEFTIFLPTNPIH